MNKEVIKKYKDVFDWWLDGGKILIKYTDDAHKNWSWINDVQAQNFEWEDDSVLVVQDDEYAELRKAQADGKVIQWEYQEDEWSDLPDNYTFGNCEVDEYRIKPDEPAFPCYYKEKSSGIIVYFKGDDNPNCYTLPRQHLGVVVKGNGGLQSSTGFTWRCWDTFTNPDRWEVYEPELYELKDIPRQVCFSTKGMSGSYYKELESGHHCYDSDGHYSKSYSPIPKIGKNYYISNKDGSYYFKPDEPKFKVGDWVRKLLDNTTIQANSNDVQHGLPNDYELWKPKQGEWCVFWDRGSNKYIVAKYSHTDIYSAHWNTTDECWSNIAPLEFLKELKDK